MSQRHLKTVMPQKKKPAPAEDEQYYSTDQVQDALNNSTIALLRWEGLKDFKTVRGKTLRDFSQGLVEALTEEVLNDKAGGLIIPPAELALALQASALLVLFKYVIPSEDQRQTFVRQLMS